MSNENLLVEWTAEWDDKAEYGYKSCPCGSNNIEQLSRSSWWAFYFECKDCNKVMCYSHGDKMGGQADCIWEVTKEEVEREKTGKYAREMFGE